MAKCYLMLEDIPLGDEQPDSQMNLAWSIHWDTEDGLQPSGEDQMSEAQIAMAMVVAALERAVLKAEGAPLEPSRIILPH